MKPISTLMKPLRSVDLATMTESPAAIERSDVCAVPAAAVVGEAMVAIVLADALIEKFGGDSIEELVANWQAFRERTAARFTHGSRRHDKERRARRDSQSAKSSTLLRAVTRTRQLSREPRLRTRSCMRARHVREAAERADRTDHRRRDRVHHELGPGMLESAYEACLAFELLDRGLAFERQKPLPLIYRGRRLDCGYRIDLLVEDVVVVEVKSIERFDRVHGAQLLSYLRLSRCKVGC